MAGITTNDVVVGFKKATTWGTEVAITSTGAMKVRLSQISVSAALRNFFRAILASRKSHFDRAGCQNYTVTATADLTYGQPWLAWLASTMGTESTPTETTGGQADYLRNLDLADSTYGSAKVIFSLGWTIEDATGAKVIVLPSVKWNQFSFTADANGVGTVTFSGVCDRPVISGATTTYANLVALSNPTGYEAAVLGGTNSYFRMNAQGGAGLTSGENKTIETYTIEINRPIRPQHALQGASSAYILEPKEIDRIDGFVTVRLSEINASSTDILSLWRNKTAQKAELFFDGTQIGTGVNRSFKFQMPSLEATPEFPAGHDVPNNNSLMTPTMRFRMLKASAAPTGMTSVTNLLRIAVVDTRSTKWTA